MSDHRERRHILFVDDDPASRRVIERVLRAGVPAAKLTCVGEGEQALALLAEPGVDLLITDLGMPGMDGIELLRQVANRRISVPVIVVTGRGGPTDETRALSGGAIEFFEKPIQAEPFIRCVQGLLAANEHRSRIEGVSIAGFVQLLNMERKTCALRVTTPETQGVLFFSSGVLVDARQDERVGVAAALEIFTWKDAVITLDALSRGRRAGFTRVEPAADDIAVLQYTGGTTGVAKGAVLLHKTLVGALLSSDAWLQPGLARKPIGDEPAAIVCALPLYHVFAFVTCGLLGMRIGGMNILIPNPRDVGGMIAELAKFRINVFPAVNTLFNAMVNHPEFARLDFSQLAISNGGGMAVQEAVAKKWLAITGCPIAEGYGLSETSSGVTCNRTDTDAYTGTVGLPMSGVHVRLLDDEGNVVEVLATYDPETLGGTAPDGRKVKSTMHWVSRPHAIDATVHRYERLFRSPHPAAEGRDPLDDLDPDSRQTTSAKAEPALAEVETGQVVQFERLGYFAADLDDTTVFHRTVGLKDEWANLQKARTT